MVFTVMVPVNSDKTETPLNGNGEVPFHTHLVMMKATFSFERNLTNEVLSHFKLVPAGKPFK